MPEENKSVFSKLDEQSEKIDDISKKLEGISINDLYALAKRTWDYGDFQTAQKYYNHISLLRPLDWEAPLYASLCNFKGYHDMYFWVKVPEQIKPIIVSTIKYIYGLNLPLDKKEKEMSRCVEILEEYIDRTNKNYFKYTNEYNSADGNYVYKLQEWYCDVIDEVNNFKLDLITSFISFLASCCLELVSFSKVIATKISKDKFDYLKSVSAQAWDVDYKTIIDRQNSSVGKTLSITDGLSAQEKQTIQLKGKMFFEAYDKVVFARTCNKNLVFGFIITISSIVGAIISLISAPLSALVFVLPFISGIFYIIRSCLERNKINCSSIISMHRRKNRLTSNNTVVMESAFNYMLLFNVISMIFSTFGGIMIWVFMFLGNKDISTTHTIIFTICFVLSSLAQYINLLVNNIRHYSKYSGKYKYLYKGKFYFFE